MTLNKTYEMASFKTLEDEGPGRFEAVVAVMGNVDFQGDRIVEGAFKNDISAKRSKGDKLPVIWSHQWINPEAHIGYALPVDIEEVALNGRSDAVTGGLKIKGTIDVHKPFAAHVFDLLKEGRVREWSFAYDVVRETKAEDGANELQDLIVLEVGPALKGANPETFTVSAKSAVEHDLVERLEKVATKPWHVEERDGQYCVVKDDGGATVACHDTREDAEAQIRALYANEAASEPEEVKVEFRPGDDTALRPYVLEALEANGTKIGRVIGAKAAAALKENINAAVDSFVAEVNGASEPKNEESEPDLSELVSIKARIEAATL